MSRKEVWLRNEKNPNISPILQPVANALLEASEEISLNLKDFPANKLWEKPAGCASIGFHLRHIVGFLDRLFTYANAKPLSSSQLEYLSKEENPTADAIEILVNDTITAIQQSVRQLATYSDEQLLAERYVGRAQIPTTTIGLLFHAAEHTMRHTGQIFVTAKVLSSHS